MVASKVWHFIDRFSFLAVVAIALTDYVLAFFAPAWYFKTGVTVYRRRFPDSTISLQELTRKVAEAAPRRVLLRPTSESSFGLRENFLSYLLYSALLHWQVLPGESGSGWVVVGRLKVYAVVLYTITIASLADSGFDLYTLAMIGWGAVITTCIVMIQRWQVKFLATILTSDANAPEQ
jgi:hypothetical protein